MFILGDEVAMETEVMEIEVVVECEVEEVNSSVNLQLLPIVYLLVLGNFLAK